MAPKVKIGWIGCGKMGVPMAGNLLDAGYQVEVWDILKENEARCVSLGAKPATSIAQLAADMDVVISMITDDKALQAISLGAGGVLGSARPGLIFVDMSTVSVTASAQVAQAAGAKQVEYLRAPVSGTVPSAEAKALTVFASGPEKAFKICDPIFQTTAKSTYYVGEGEQARTLKLAINSMTGLIPAIAAEALVFGLKGGLDWELMIDMIENSVAASGMYKLKAQALKERNYKPAFTVAQMRKDFGLILDSAEGMDQPMPLVSLVRQYYLALAAKGKSDLDYYALLSHWEEMAGVAEQGPEHK
jgi:3-hydroxyisobutyrate dehydrogenase-like beta-hydroxyacid dehydrogenase